MARARARARARPAKHGLVLPTEGGARSLATPSSPLAPYLAHRTRTAAQDDGQLSVGRHPAPGDGLAGIVQPLREVAVPLGPLGLLARAAAGRGLAHHVAGPLPWVAGLSASCRGPPGP